MLQSKWKINFWWKCECEMHFNCINEEIAYMVEAIA